MMFYKRCAYCSHSSWFTGVNPGVLFFWCSPSASRLCVFFISAHHRCKARLPVWLISNFNRLFHMSRSSMQEQISRRVLKLPLFGIMSLSFTVSLLHGPKKFRLNCFLLLFKTYNYNELKWNAASANAAVIVSVLISQKQNSTQIV